MATLTNPTARSGVFISYSRKDGEALARELRAKLESRRIAVWQDRTCMEGGRDWWEQIKEALNRVEYLVFVMTPAALQSDIVRKEWRYARQQGVCVYPVIAGANAGAGIGIDISALPRWMAGIHWYDLAHQEARFFNDLNTRCRLQRVPFMVEDLPEDFVARAAEFDALKTQLLARGENQPVAVTAALRGAGGYGKTALARAICHDDQIQNAFDDGILWVTLGERPSESTLIDKLFDLIETLSNDRPGFKGLEAAATRLRELLEDRDILLVIDDVWRAADLKPFLTGGSRCARLITTRKADTLPAGAVKVAVDQMQLAEGRQLMGHGLPAGFERELSALAERLGEWPLLLKLANRMLTKRVNDRRQSMPDALRELGAALTRRGVTAFDAHNAVQRNDAVAKTLEVSLAGLDAGDAARLLELSVFEEDLNVPLQVLQTYWEHTAQLDASDVEETCLRLFDHSMLLELDLNERHLRLHDAIRAWLICRPGDLTAVERHSQLLASYANEGAAWDRLADDGYLYRHLAQHLVAAERADELHGLLLNLRWIQARVVGLQGDERAGPRFDVHNLLSDYDLLRDAADAADAADVGLVQRALRMSTHVICKHPEQLQAQLLGRLGNCDLPAVRRLCDDAAAQLSELPLFPLRPALDAPGPLLLTLAGHTDRVCGATLLADEQRVLSWSGDGTLKLWDLERGELLYSLGSHEDAVRGMVLVAEGRRALSWWSDHTLKLWDLQRGGLLHNLVGHEHAVGGAVAEGRRALSWSHDGSLNLWDLDQGTLLNGSCCDPDGVYDAALAADGRRALSWSRDRALKLWDLERGELLHRLQGHRGGVIGAAWLADGCRALSWSKDQSLKLWDLERGEPLCSLDGHEASVNGAALLADGCRALSWSEDGSLKLWDLARGKLLHNLSGHEAWVIGALLLADDTRALSWSTDGDVKLWDLERGELLHHLRGHSQWVCGAKLGADGRRALSWSTDGALKLWDLAPGTLLCSLDAHEHSVSGAALLADSRRVLSWSVDGSLRLWDLERADLLRKPAGHESSVVGMALCADGGQALSWSLDCTLKLWDLERGEQLHNLTGHSQWVRGATLLTDGRQALSWSVDGGLKLWDVACGQLLHTLSGHTDSVRGATLLADGRRALSWSNDHTLKLWDLDRGELLQSLSGHQSWVMGAELLDDGLRALSWSVDRTLKVWSLARGELLRTLVGDDDGIEGAFMLADGQRALAWSDGPALTLWDLDRGELLQRLVGHEGEVRGAMRLADGRSALSWSVDGTLKRWDLQSGELQQSLCAHAGCVGGVRPLADGRRLLSWCADGTLKLWDLDCGELLRNLSGHDAWVNGAKLLAGDRRALSWSEDRTLRLWDLDAGRQLGMYVADAVLSAPVVGLDGRRVLAGDGAGRIHCIRLGAHKPSMVS